MRMRLWIAKELAKNFKVEAEAKVAILLMDNVNLQKLNTETKVERKKAKYNVPDLQARADMATSE